MLIRTMLRVNADRRATIEDIASHWWLNFGDENMPNIALLPENQVTDTTPISERKETMIVQDLADEADVFMEFSHLSAATRKKIEEFRRRRKEAEQYIAESPILKRGKQESKSKITSKSKLSESQHKRQKQDSKVSNSLLIAYTMMRCGCNSMKSARSSQRSKVKECRKVYSNLIDFRHQ